MRSTSHLGLLFLGPRDSPPRALPDRQRGTREGSGFKSFWPTCGVGLGAAEEGSSVCDPEFDRV